ncbi:MAG: NAD kinase [Betaproteobacteria bacterium]|nr:MAG: NAD kinase [Betaproteobacteria bacterium]
MPLTAKPLAPCNVAIAARPSQRDGAAGRDMREPVELIAKVLEKHGYTPVIENQTSADLDGLPWRSVAMEAIGDQCGLVVAVGGDGTLISVGRQVALKNVPVIGVNQGRLGFLTDLSLANVEQSLPNVLAGRYREERRVLLETRHGEHGEPTLAMNDVVVNRGGASSLVDLEISLDNRFAYGFRADGVIVATPTGSTAYALSADGPIIAPFVNAFTIVPIAPHALTNRPIVIADDSEIRITVARAREAFTSIDGHQYIPLVEGDFITIKRAAASVRLWHPLDYDYYHTLREKLGWTETPEGLAPRKI